MNKSKILLMVAIPSVLAVAGTAAMMSGVQDVLPGLAGDCTHTHVEHYNGKATPNSTGYVEHWACCECHQAWADEARTILLSENTTTDRSKLDIEVGMGLETDWNPANTTAIYDANDGYKFKAKVTNTAADAYTAIETSGSAFQLDANSSFGYFGQVTNKTTAVIRVDVHRRAWGARSEQIYLGIGETKSFKVSVDNFNAEQSGGNYGFALLCYNTAEQTGEGYIEVTKPEYLNGGAAILDHIEDANYRYLDTAYNATYGVEVSRADLPSASTYHIVRKGTIDADAYSGVKFKVYNGSSTDTNKGNIWSEAWEDYHADCPALKASEWNDVFIPARVWNANTMMSFYDLGAIDGCFKFADFKLVEKQEGVVVFGEKNSEKVTIGYPDPTPEEPGRQVWTAALKTVGDKGPSFSIDWSAGCLGLAAEGKAKIDAALYSTVEFYVYNGGESDFTMYSTSDWAVNTQYGNMPVGTWTKCEMPVAEFNKGTTYIYPSTSTGSMLMTYWVAK
ncbi:MAG: hypothetical protein MJ239_04520 [Bacilli bacterium]|nr:hypothetical protein [Bacilli bacterium]